MSYGKSGTSQVLSLGYSQDSTDCNDSHLLGQPLGTATIGPQLPKDKDEELSHRGAQG